MLSGQFAENRDKARVFAQTLLIFQVLISVGYFVAMLIISENPFTRFYLPSLMMTTAIALFLWWRGRAVSSVMFNLLALNIFLFVLSERLSIQTGVDLYFVAVGAAALALFGYENWKMGVGYALLSTLLFIISHVVDFEAIPVRRFTELQETTFFVVNSLVAFSIAIYCVTTVMKLYFSVEIKLREIKATIEKQNQELRKTNSELDSFVYSASHDLRAPLSSLSGLIGVMELEKAKDIDLYLPRIKDRIGAMDNFIKEIIDYSRNSRLHVSKEFILIKPIISEVAANMQYFENAGRVQFECEVEENAVVRTDPYRIRVILNNLMSNAIKYADLRKERPCLKVRMTSTNGLDVIEVIDNGIGIREEHQPKVFNMFFRGTEHSKGSGLGLYIVKESLEKIGGKMELDSVYGEGSTFRLILNREN